MSHSLDAVPLTDHARLRMAQRGLRKPAVLAAIDYGREVMTRGVCLHFIGRKEVAKARRKGLDLSRYEGVHVLRSHDGTVITVYRNHQLNLRSRPARRRSA